MTDEELAEIRARCDDASMGPWTAIPEHDSPMRCAGIYDGGGDEVVKTDCGIYPPDMADANFIAHAREDIPALLAEVERLRRAVDEATRKYLDAKLEAANRLTKEEVKQLLDQQAADLY